MNLMDLSAAKGRDDNSFDILRAIQRGEISAAIDYYSKLSTRSQISVITIVISELITKNVTEAHAVYLAASIKELFEIFKPNQRLPSFELKKYAKVLTEFRVAVSTSTLPTDIVASNAANFLQKVVRLNATLITSSEQGKSQASESTGANEVVKPLGWTSVRQERNPRNSEPTRPSPKRSYYEESSFKGISSRQRELLLLDTTYAVLRQDHRLITVEGIDKLTPAILTNQLLPFVSALIDLQHIINSLMGKQNPQEILIRRIELNSPPDIELTSSLSEAVDTVHSLLDKDRRANKKKLEELEVQGQVATVRQEESKVDPEILELQKELLKQQVLNQTLVNERIAIENEHLRLENIQLMLATQKAVIESSVAIIEKYAVGLSETDRMMHILQLVKPLECILSSQLVLRTNNSGGLS